MANRNGEPRASRLAARELLLLCATSTPSPEARKRLNQILRKPVDWEHFVELAAFQRVTPLVTHNLLATGCWSGIPEIYGNPLKRAFNVTACRNIILSSELAAVISAFQQQGIQTVCLKGTAMAEVLYGNACLRSVTDIDILVHPEDKAGAAAILTKLGYRQLRPQQPRDHPFHEEPYYKKASFPIFLEMHLYLDDKRLVAFPERDIWRRTQPLIIQGVQTLTLSPEDNLLFLANHLYKHDSERLKFLCDIAELVKKFEGSLDWEYIVSAARSWKINPATYFGLKRAKELLGAPVPANYLDLLRPGALRCWLLNIIEGEDKFVSRTKNAKLRSETSTLAHALMMKGMREMGIVLSSHRSPRKGQALFGTAFWTTVTLGASVGRYVTKLVCGQPDR